MNFDKQKKMQLHQILKKQQMKIKTHQNIVESKNLNNKTPQDNKDKVSFNQELNQSKSEEFVDKLKYFDNLLKKTKIKKTKNAVIQNYSMNIQRDKFYSEEDNNPTFDMRKSNAKAEKWIVPNQQVVK